MLSQPKRSPGGQPGHQGKTRKGFGRVDRYEVLKPLVCAKCGSLRWNDTSVQINTQQVAQLVAGQQKCLAHLRRHFQRLSKTKGLHHYDIAETCIDLIDEAFKKHRIWRQTENDADYRTWAADFRIRVTAQITQWLECAGHEAGKLLRSLRDKEEQWWYFLEHPHVPPDNNLAERCLRIAVTKRKVSGGSRSLARFAQTAILLSVIQSCRLQGRSVLTFFQQALQASRGLFPRPSLVPQSVLKDRN